MDNLSFKEQATTGLIANSGNADGMKPHGRFHVECFDSEGNLRWAEDADNTVVTVGKNDMEAKYFSGSTYTAAFYVGLKASVGGISLADTMAVHSGWTESTSYSNSTRPAFTAGTPSGGVVANTASPAVYNINATTTIYGCFVTTDSTKSGTTGTLFSVADFASSRAVLSGDTLSVTYQLTLS